MYTEKEQTNVHFVFVSIEYIKIKAHKHKYELVTQSHEFYTFS